MKYQWTNRLILLLLSLICVTHLFLELLFLLLVAVVIDTGTDDAALSLYPSSELRSKPRALIRCITILVSGISVVPCSFNHARKKECSDNNIWYDLILYDTNSVYVDVLIIRRHKMTAIWLYFSVNDQSRTSGGGTTASQVKPRSFYCNINVIYTEMKRGFSRNMVLHKTTQC